MDLTKSCGASEMESIRGQWEAVNRGETEDLRISDQ